MTWKFCPCPTRRILTINLLGEDDEDSGTVREEEEATNGEGGCSESRLLAAGEESVGEDKGEENEEPPGLFLHFRLPVKLRLRQAVGSSLSSLLALGESSKLAPSEAVVVVVSVLMCAWGSISPNVRCSSSSEGSSSTSCSERGSLVEDSPGTIAGCGG